MVPQVRGDVEEQEKRMEVLSPGNTKNNKFQQLRKRQSILAVSAGTQSHVSYEQRKHDVRVHSTWSLKSFIFPGVYLSPSHLNMASADPQSRQLLLCLCFASAGSGLYLSLLGPAMPMSWPGHAFTVCLRHPQLQAGATS